MLNDLRSAARSLGKSPGFSLVASADAVLALGLREGLMLAAACLVPAWRAMRINPLTALHHD